MVDLVRERWSSKVRELVIGATPAEGGTRSHTLTLGGESTLPYLHFEGEMPHRPLVAAEVWDHRPPAWPEPLMSALGPLADDPAEWARTAVEEWGADLVVVRLQGANPDYEDTGVEEAVGTVRKVLDAVSVPIGVIGCDDADKDNEILPAVAEECRGENIMMGIAKEDNYKTIAAASIINDHALICNSPIDINIAKQLNILVNELGVKLGRIIIDPTTGGLGYGIEYVYSIIERITLGALSNDTMLAMPVINFVGFEAWKAKEARETAEDYPEWGSHAERGLLWETLTATALLQAGTDCVVLCHPESIKRIQQHLDRLMTVEA